MPKRIWDNNVVKPEVRKTIHLEIRLNIFVISLQNAFFDSNSSHRCTIMYTAIADLLIKEYEIVWICKERQ